MTNISVRTSRLFAMPSFIRGIARVLDMGSTLNKYNDSPNGDTADCRALQDDWCQIGDELRDVLETYSHGE